MDVEHMITQDSGDENQVWCVFSWALNMKGAKSCWFFWKAWPKWPGQNQVSQYLTCTKEAAGLCTFISSSDCFLIWIQNICLAHFLFLLSSFTTEMETEEIKILTYHEKSCYADVKLMRKSPVLEFSSENLKLRKVKTLSRHVFVYGNCKYWNLLINGKKGRTWPYPERKEQENTTKLITWSLD